MKQKHLVLAGSLFILLSSCGNPGDTQAISGTDGSNVEQSVGQSGVVDSLSKPNIVQVANSSNDHTTLAAAIKAAELGDALSNAGPFTVFAPTNAAFDKLPKETLDGLMKKEKKADLQNILGYHTYVGSLNTEYMTDGQEFDMVYGGKVKITRQGDKIFVNGSEIITSIPTSNGIIHVIGDVLLPK